MGFADLLPVIDIGDEYTGTYNIFQAGANSFESRLDVLQDLDALRIGISNTHNLPALIGSGCA